MTHTDSTFSHWLIKLGSKVRYLQQHMYTLDVVTLERDTNTAQAWLQHMYSYAETYQIDVAHYFNGLTSVEAGLQDLRDQITRRREPRWHRALNWVCGAINIVANILGLRPLLSLFRLPTGQQRFLP